MLHDDNGTALDDARLVLAFEVLPVDYTDFCALWQQRLKPSKSKKSFQIAYVFYALAPFELIIFAYAKDFLAIFVLIALLGFLICWRRFKNELMYFFIHQRTKSVFKNYPDQSDIFCGRRKLILNQQEIIFMDAQQPVEWYQEYALKSYTGFSENARCFILWLGQVIGIVIPKRDLTEAEQDQLRSWLKAH